MRKKLATVLQTGGVIVLLLTAGASDANALTLPDVLRGLALAAVLLLLGAWLRRAARQIKRVQLVDLVQNPS